MHRPQPTHRSWSMVAPLPGVTWGASWAQMRTHRPQLTHFSCSTWGLPALCISILPAREPQPMPRFFSAPPKPVSSCPLKWEREMMTSASMMAEPILASLT